MIHQDVIPALLNALGAENVHTSVDKLQAYAGDKWIATHLPDVVCLPTSTAQVADIMRIATLHNTPVTARGGGVGYVGGCVPARGGIVLSLEKMYALLELSPQDGIAVVQPGLITAHLQQAASRVGWFYPPDPASKNDCTLGGNIATNAGGPRCLKYGVTKNYVLGLEVVLADGTILHTGGRTHKNACGFDLGSLFIGSEGLLGIITAATLRIIPAPQQFGIISAGFAQFSHAAAAVQSVLAAGHLPTSMEITDAFTLQAARNYLGTSIVPEGLEGHILIELDGRVQAVETELKEISTLLQSIGATQLTHATDTAQVEALRALRAEFSTSLRATGMTKLNEDIVIPRSRLVDLVNFCHELSLQFGTPIACFGHSGDGNIHTNIMVEDYADPHQKDQADACVHTLMQWVTSVGGCITGEHGIGIAKAQWFPNAIGSHALLLHQKLKQILDPLSILNPDKLGL